MAKLDSLKPLNVFKYFEEICNIPHGSENMNAISEYCVKFAENHSLKYIRDDANNIIIFKSATDGYENAGLLSCKAILIWFVRKQKNQILIL